MFQEDLHTELIIKDEYLEMHTGESVTYCTEVLPVADCNTVKQETPGVEECAVIVVECTTVKEEIKEENMDIEDPLSVHIHQGKLHYFNILLSSKLLFSSIIIFLFVNLYFVNMLCTNWYNHK